MGRYVPVVLIVFVTSACRPRSEVSEVQTADTCSKLLPVSYELKGIKGTVLFTQRSAEGAGDMCILTYSDDNASFSVEIYKGQKYFNPSTEFTNQKFTPPDDLCATDCDDEPEAGVPPPNETVDDPTILPSEDD